MDRTTSAAKTYEPDGLQGTSLENAPDAGQAFDRATEQTPAHAQEGIGSEQVQRDSADLDMRPTPEIAREPDRENHEQGMAKDDANATAKNYEALQQGLQSRQAENGYEQQRGGPEMG
jgi:hypothetical protein